MSNQTIEALEKKYRLLARKREIRTQLAGDPREPFYSALKKDLEKVDREIIEADEGFLRSYAAFRETLDLDEEGEIEVSKLSAENRVILRRIRALIKAISEAM